MRKYQICLAAVLLSMGGAVWAAGQQAEPFSSDAGRFSVQFPFGWVKHNQAPVKLDGGGSSTLYEFWVEQASGDVNYVSYIVMYNDYPPNYANDGTDAALGRDRDSALKGKTLLSDKAINLNGVPGREFTAKDDTLNVSIRQFLSGKRLYQLIGEANYAIPEAQISDFMNSFKIY